MTIAADMDDDDTDDAYVYHDVLKGVLHTECAVNENGENVL